MCCFLSTLIFFGPRLGFLVYWLIAPIRVNLSFQVFNFPFLVSLLGLLFLPWTTLMYVIIFPLDSYDWIWMGLAIAADIFSYMGGFQNRSKVPYYTGP